MAANTGQTSPDNDWLSKTMEDALEPGLPIVDPHHHLWLRNGYRKARAQVMARHTYTNILEFARVVLLNGKSDSVRCYALR